MRDVSDGGIQLSVNRDTPTGTVVQVSGEAGMCSGSVRYCIRADNGFLVGVQFIGRSAYRPLSTYV